MPPTAAPRDLAYTTALAESNLHSIPCGLPARVEMREPRSLPHNAPFSEAPLVLLSELVSAVGVGVSLRDPVGESEDDQLFPAGGVALWSERGHM